MERTAGVRDLKARLRHYLEIVREGGAVIITDRGRPVARLTAIRDVVRAATIDDVLDELEAEGPLERAAEPARKRQPPPVPVSGGVSANRIVAQLRR
jgi:prevent-host-death family protein